MEYLEHTLSAEGISKGSKVEAVLKMPPPHCPKKGTPLLAANRLARWALWENKFGYTIEYRKTADHGNADALSRLSSGDDINFNREESGEDMGMVCAITVLSLHIQPVDAIILRQESQKDPVISSVMRYVREG